MTSPAFLTTSGETIARELLVLYLNTGTSSTPAWSAIGKRVEDSSIEFDWGDEQIQDILGDTYGEMKKPVLTQSFDPYKLDAGDAAAVYLWENGVKDHNPQKLSSCDVLLVHCYYGASDSAMFAERYPASMIKPTGLGGEGGGSIEMPFDVTYGGTRSVGTAAISSGGVVTFTPAA